MPDNFAARPLGVLDLRNPDALVIMATPHGRQELEADLAEATV